MNTFRSRNTLCLLIPYLFVLGGCSSQNSEGQKQVAEMERSVASVEKKAFDKGRVLSKNEAEKVLDSVDKLAASQSPETKARMKQITDAAKGYRADVEAFGNMGGASLKTIKSKQDLDKRISALEQVDKSAEKLNEITQANGADKRDFEIYNLEHKMFLKLKEQLMFYKAHYGKWQISPDGTVAYAVKPAELESFNKCVREFKALGNEQVKLLKAKNEERISRTKQE